MKVGYDVSSLKSTGIFRYNEELIQTLAALYPQEFTPVFLPQREPANKEYYKAFKNFVYNRFTLPHEIQALGVDLFHCTKNFFTPITSEFPTVTTVHDIIPLVLREQYISNTLEFLYYRYNFGVSINHADALIVISDFTRGELIRYYPSCKNRIHVIHQGCDPHFCAGVDKPAAEKRMRAYGVTRPYMLTMGGAEPRKNVQFLVDVFSSGLRDMPHDLVVLGGQWRNLQLSIPREGAGRIHVLADLPREDLAVAYAAASTFVFPSLYEGFGLPILEAMACGTPVVAHAGSSIPEVAGDAALLVAMTDSEAASCAIKRVLTEPAFAQDLILAGKERVAMLPWEKTARHTVEVYNLVLRGK